jgi:hypothetical protein
MHRYPDRNIGHRKNRSGSSRKGDKWPSNRAIADLVQQAQKQFNRALARTS